MKIKKMTAVLAALLMLCTAGCSSADESISIEETQNTTAPAEETEAEAETVTDAPTEAEPEYVSPYAGMTAEEITASLTLEQKLLQMQIPAVYFVDDFQMATANYGSILSLPSEGAPTGEEWVEIIDGYQKNALASDSPVPFLYGQDSVHGVNYAADSVVFPQNINIGNANDPELTYQMGLAVADEMKISHLIWNYAPCVAVAEDPRWGRTYESYSSDPEIVKSLSTAFTEGQLDGGVIVCPKHFIGDGSVTFGTGEHSEGYERLIDRGNAELTEKELDAQLSIYKSLIDAGAQSIMISHSALNGVKMHENKELILDVLRGELGFEGVVVSDWNSIQNIDSGDSYKEKIIIAVNSGIDWLMEPHDYEDTVKCLIEAVEEGSITEERINEAVTRIIQLKMDAGLIDDPYLDKLETEQTEMGSQEYRELARKLAAKSQVLLKNEGDILPLKSGTKVYVTGPAADDTGVQSGGWTRAWLGDTDADCYYEWVSGGTTILEALEECSAEYGIEIITDEDEAGHADVTLLCLGEEPYAEWHGDAASLSIADGDTALAGNAEAIEEAESLGKPVVTLIVAGRNMITSEYDGGWDALVMCGLPGSEGTGVADVLVGAVPFTGKLSMPWYADEDDISAGNAVYDTGFGICTE